MSSSSARTKEKIRRVTTACDNCRNKKVRCDGPHMPDNRCSICVASNADCTYFRVAKKRGPPKEYVNTLETRLSQLEKLLKTHRPDIDISKELSKVDKPRRPIAPNGLSSMTVSATTRAELSESKIISTDISTLAEDEDDSSDYDTALIDSQGSILRFNHEKTKFFGKSSGLGLFRAVRDYKLEHFRGTRVADFSFSVVGTRRPQFWRTDSYLQPSTKDIEKVAYDYPEPELLAKLIDAYFTKVNLYLPVFHRPTFDKTLASGTHLRDEGFGAVVLLMCAIADDPLPPPASYLSPYFRQVQRSNRTILGPVRLYDVQLNFLTAIYLMGACPPENAWLIAGVGIRMCQDVGAHRRKTYGTTPTVEGESWKRLFWGFYHCERWMSCSFGRQCNVREEDCDIDYPIECDDEYWVNPDPELAFKQPPGKPSTVSFFVASLKASRILGCTLRTLYSSRKTKIFYNMVGPEREQHVVAELDSAINEWLDCVPPHLKWDPNRENSVFARPFITHRRTATAFPSLAICTNAARSCSKIIGVLHKKYNALSIQTILPIFTIAIVLLMNMWGQKNKGDRTEDLEALSRLMEALESLEKTCFPAAHIWDLLASMGALGQVYELAAFDRGISAHRGPRDPAFEGEGASVRLQVGRRSDGNSQLRPVINISLGQQQSRLLKEISRTRRSRSQMSRYNFDPKLGMLCAADRPHIQRKATGEDEFLQEADLPSSLDNAVYNEMLSSFDNALVDNQPENLPFPAMPATSRFQLAPMEEPVGGFGYQFPSNDITVDDAFDFMSNAPATMVWDEWDSYVVDLMKGVHSTHVEV